MTIMAGARKDEDEDEDIFVDDEEAATPGEGDETLQSFLKSQAATNDRVATALELLSKQSQNGPTPQIPITAYKAKTPWNPSGERYKVKLTRGVWMNGSRLRDIMLSQSEIEKLNALKPGRYRGGRWVVEEGAAQGQASAPIHLTVPNKTPEQKTENMMLFRSLGELLDLILAEQATLAS